MRFGTEIVAREMGLRRDRPTTEENFEASAGDQMTQADVVWSVWKAKTAPSTYGAEALSSFRLGDYSEKVRSVVTDNAGIYRIVRDPDPAHLETLVAATTFGFCASAMANSSRRRSP